MSKTHEKLKEECEERIRELFGDTSVPNTTTLESLEHLESVIESLKACIQEDLKCQQP